MAALLGDAANEVHLTRASPEVDVHQIPETAPFQRLRLPKLLSLSLLCSGLLGYMCWRSYSPGETLTLQDPRTAGSVLHDGPGNSGNGSVADVRVPGLSPFVAPPFIVGFNGRCGPISCRAGDTCCPGTLGHICVSAGGTCCQGKGGSIACGRWSTCHFNDGGNAYCCGFATSGENNVCVLPRGACFPGEAMVFVEGSGVLPIRKLRKAERVLVQQQSGALVYEPVLGFLHSWRGEADDNASYLTIRHHEGVFRVSANHLVFTEDGDKLANELKYGDRLLLASGVTATSLGLVRSVAVLGVDRGARSRDMYAPLTPSGTIVIDGILASNYATHALERPLHHATIHAFFFPVRAYFALGLTESVGLLCKLRVRLGVPHRWLRVCVGGGPANRNGTDEIHPFVNTLSAFAIAADHRLAALTS
eukprot:TRINITY_DN19189_c0_g1_i1.p1 TRINITY_DN19189_c0_g1~~TRINITY_DN19189_c0_g1_i1.p1  ORF type:complete len:420 (-),score=36.61 TRINITY_DN19189_c0_g1_i1:66-1325(-)